METSVSLKNFENFSQLNFLLLLLVLINFSLKRYLQNSLETQNPQ